MLDNKTFSIGELSKITNLSTATINYYVKIGVLSPPKKINKTRAIYSQNHINLLNTIKKLKEKKINLSGIKEIINNHSLNSVIDKKIKQENLTINDLIKKSNISNDIYDKLIDSKIIKIPKISDDGIPYHTLNDLTLSQAVGDILNLGINIQQILKNKDHLMLSKLESILLSEYIKSIEGEKNTKNISRVIQSFDIIRKYLRRLELEKILYQK
ncbi:MAG: helix-turn-helix domain-containing protein [Dehalococcoidia bacterium]